MTESGPIVTFHTNQFIYTTLPKDYTFTVTCSRIGTESVEAKKTITLSAASLPGSVELTCMINCDASAMNPSYELVLKALCVKCTGKLSYFWSLSPKSKGRVLALSAQNTRGGLNDVILRINAGVFASADNESYTIDMVGEYFLEYFFY